MPSSIHKLSNLASGHSFELEVSTGSDVAESDSDDAGKSGHSQKVANPPSNLDSSPTGNVI